VSRRIPPKYIRLLGPGDKPPAAPPTPAVEPFEVRVRRAMGGCYSLIGHDGLAEPIIEVRVQRKHMTHGLVNGLRRWCRDHDAKPDLGLVP